MSGISGSSATLAAASSSNFVSTDPKGSGSLEPTSPRSVEACLRLGIEPAELRFIPLDKFFAEEHDTELAQLAFQHVDKIRQVSMIHDGVTLQHHRGNT